MSEVRVGVIGAGWWGCEAHLPALREHPHARISAVQTLDRKKANQIAADFGAVHACTTCEELLAINELDAVIVSSTPNVHFAQAKAALQRGLHVLIEKPMTFTADEAAELVSIAKQRELHFLISAPWHYTAHGTSARGLVQSGALGQVKMISVLMTNFTQGFYRGLPWNQLFAGSEAFENAAPPYQAPGQSSYSDAAVAGGGQVYCQVSHVAAYLGFLTGRQPAEVFARFDNAGTDVDVHDILNIKLDDGTLVAVASTGATMLTDRNFEVRLYGSQGMLFMELWKGKMEAHDSQGNVKRLPNLAEAEIYPMSAPTNNLVDVVRGDAPNGSPAELGLSAMRMIEAACRSAATGANVICE